MNTSFFLPASSHWQPALQSGKDRVPAEFVEGVADVAQAIAVILSTPVGSDPHRPEFGNPALEMVDADPELAALYLIAQCPEAIVRWESRVKEVTVAVLFEPLGARLRVQVDYRLADGLLRQTEIVL